MVTLSFLIVLVLSTLLSTIIDTYLYELSLSEALYFLLDIEMGTRKTIVVAALMSGLIASFVLDYRLRKKRSDKDKARGGPL